MLAYIADIVVALVAISYPDFPLLFARWVFT